MKSQGKWPVWKRLASLELINRHSRFDTHLRASYIYTISQHILFLMRIIISLFYFSSLYYQHVIHICVCEVNTHYSHREEMCFSYFYLYNIMFRNNGSKWLNYNFLEFAKIFLYGSKHRLSTSFRNTLFDSSFWLTTIRTLIGLNEVSFSDDTGLALCRDRSGFLESILYCKNIQVCSAVRNVFNY